MLSQNTSSNNETSSDTPKSSTPQGVSLWISIETLKNYLILQRRALLQSVAADERFIKDLDTISSKLTVINPDNKDVGVVTIILSALRRNTEERRKAFLQIVRDTERRYNMGVDKKKYRGRR